MRKRLLGFLLAILGFGGMALAGYLFVNGSGGRGHLIEVICYMIVGASCFFAGINYIYDSYTSFTKAHGHNLSDIEEISPIQEQWRTIQVAKSIPSPTVQVSTRAAEAV